MKLEIFFLVLLSILNLIETEDKKNCEYLKRFCKPPCISGNGCRYNHVIYRLNCREYHKNCLKKA